MSSNHNNDQPSLQSAVSASDPGSRLVCQGFTQEEGTDYTETFAPVIRYESVRFLLALAAQFERGIHQMDVDTAFLNGELDEEIYMELPKGFGFDKESEKVCRLKKSLYGLKQAPLCWYKVVKKALMDMGFEGPKSWAIQYSKQPVFTITGYSDADWACDKNTRKSTTGYVFMLAGGPISWRSSRQPSVTLSSAESEFVALSEAVKDALWLKPVVRERRLKLAENLVIYEDNTACINISKNPVLHHRTEHVDTRYKFVRENVQANVVEVRQVESENNIADMLTKGLKKVQFARLCDLLRRSN
ncbi:hypothetical protein TRICI_005058 [Trichomonascus ciferrii]|uniref:Reverse transcriptase Ty1/copia-type domain-containing protein n=1 Tax=Trichomonascus ciferrii TaxID=44093 RepID=A0A642UWH9_9ASCO|nr:hypothetical protein TRICI_005058 [Trichomonascus ciferrii]